MVLLVFPNGVKDSTHPRCEGEREQQHRIQQARGHRDCLICVGIIIQNEEEERKKEKEREKN